MNNDWHMSEQLRTEIIKREIINVEKLTLFNDFGEPYSFKKYSFGEMGNYIDWRLMNAIVKNFKAFNVDFDKIDYIISPEPGGHTWGMLLAYELGCSINILRINKKNIISNNSTVVYRKTAYDANEIIFDNVKNGDKVIVIDDVISSGCTIECIIKTLYDMKVQVLAVLTIVCKGAGADRIKKQYGIPVLYMLEDF